MSEIKQISVPDIGDFDTVEIIEILVNPGDQVKAEDPLITLESDKATMEIPSPSTGIVKEIKVAVGEQVSEGTVILTLQVQDVGSTIDASIEAVTAENKPEQSSPSSVIDDKLEQSSNSEETSVVKSDSTQSTHTRPATLPPPVEKSGGALPHASPSVRKLARELGANLALIRGSGPKGRILIEDVKLWVKQQLSKPQESAGSGIPEIPEVDFTKFGDTEILQLSRIKKLSGPHLQRAWLNIPHVTHHDEADITELEAFRKSLKQEAESEGIRITLLSFVMKALVNALKKFPTFNSSLVKGGESIILKQYFNVGIAVDTPNGLVVPVIKEVDRKNIFALAREMAELSERARDGKLKLEDMQGGCISISSLGGIGGTAFTPIINAPEVAILGLSRAQMKPVWDGEEFQPKLVLPMDLSYDHRVIDGAQAAHFMVYLSKSFADVRRLSL